MTQSKRAAERRVLKAAKRLWRSWGKPTPEDTSYEGVYWRLNAHEQNFADALARQRKGRKC
jgi:hypothetical protein